MEDGHILKVLKRSAFLVVKVQELEVASKFRHVIAKGAGTAKHVCIVYHAANSVRKLTVRFVRKSKLTTQSKYHRK